MLPPSADLNFAQPTCRDLVIAALSDKPSLSAKKVHRVMQQQLKTNVSYQAVHKTLRTMADSGIVKIFEREYYLNPEWVNSLSLFVEKLKNKKPIGKPTEGDKSTANSISPDSIATLSIQPIRFVPFYLGHFHRDPLPSWCVVLSKTKNKIMFKTEKHRYAWFNTGVCVQIIEEEVQRLGVVDFLVERRKQHQNIINFNASSSREIKALVQTFAPSKEGKLSYVMSIHLIGSSNSVLPPTNMLKLLAEPGILGIHDNPKQIVDREVIRKAQQKLCSGPQEKIDSPSIYELRLDDTTAILASWSNVVFSCPAAAEQHLRQLFVELECELQQLWFYFYTMKNALRRFIVHKNKRELRNIVKQRQCFSELWNEFENISATEDSHGLLIKEALIKTSRISRVYRELENLINYGLREIKP